MAPPLPPDTVPAPVAEPEIQPVLESQDNVVINQAAGVVEAGAGGEEIEEDPPEVYSSLSSEINKITSLTECIELLSLIDARKKFLDGKTCKCGKNLSANYIESGICRTCTNVKVEKVMCQQCELVALNYKFREGGVCSNCSRMIAKGAGAK